MEVIWKGLKYNNIDYSDRFEISNFGELRNIKTKHVYKKHINKNGYYQICVSIGSRKSQKVIKIHKAVAENFIENINDYPIVGHMNNIKTDNRSENLYWTTYQENTQKAIDDGLIRRAKGEERPNHRLTWEIVEYIRNNYIPGDKDFGCRALAKKFNVNHRTVSNVITNKTWKE